MNANELAEIQAFKTEELTMWERNHTASMLRQQQVQIEALKNELKRYADALGEERDNKALKNHEIAAVLTQVLDDCGLLKKENK
jgi:glucuronate isomerase